MILAVAVAVALGIAAFAAARYWQDREPQYDRVAAAGCDLRTGACERPLPDGGSVVFAIDPATIPLMRTLALTVRLQGGLAARRVVVDVRGLNMDMGLNRTALVQDGDTWRGETILPLCSQRRMEWEAAVRIDAGRRWEVAFPFFTQR